MPKKGRDVEAWIEGSYEHPRGPRVTSTHPLPIRYASKGPLLFTMCPSNLISETSQSEAKVLLIRTPYKGSSRLVVVD